MSANRGSVRLEPSAKRVRVYLGGEGVADSAAPVLGGEIPYSPAYYFPAADVREDLLTPDGEAKHSPSRGDGALYTVKAGGREVRGAALRYHDSPVEELRD